VVAGYRALREKFGSAKFVFGGVTFDPEVIAEVPDERVDLATIRVDGLQFQQTTPGYWASAAATLQTYSPGTWPLDPPAQREATVTVGWPVKFRKFEVERKIEFAAFPMLGSFVDGVNATGFVIPFEREYFISSDFDPTNPAIFEKTLGGMSGAPVFALHRQGIEPLQLIGIVRAYGEAFDALYCARADLIQPDGSVSNP
jgi:hypothetical protein